LKRRFDINTNLRERKAGMSGQRRFRILVVAWSLAWVGVTGVVGPAGAQEYHVDTGRSNLVRFVSDAPLEDFEGVTDRIDGFLLLPHGWVDGGGEWGSSQFYFEVDLASLDTGIGLRNRHMRNNYLETDEFPYASFKGKVSRLTQVAPGRFRAVTVGAFTVHGVEREREMVCEGEGSPENLRIRCQFQVILSDHDIPIPKLMFMKINEVMDVDLDFHLQPASGGKAS
jgi:polyisoprenoid-binding protein YceI